MDLNSGYLCSQTEGQELVDVFSYLDLIEDCLDRAETSQTACLKGILKADITLTNIGGDADIGFIVLVKRAELLYIAVGSYFLYTCNLGLYVRAWSVNCKFHCRSSIIMIPVTSLKSIATPWLVASRIVKQVGLSKLCYL